VIVSVAPREVTWLTNKDNKKRTSVLDMMRFILVLGIDDEVEERITSVRMASKARNYMKLSQAMDSHLPGEK
jgi:hypothetical protein